mgnify:CR=1 FL=1
MKLSFYGADQCVTGSCHCLEVNGKKILVDCGLQQGRDEVDNGALPFHSGSIDYVLVTHAHIDHTGRIPMLVKQGFQGRILTTRLTANLMDIMLLDSAHIQESDAEWKNRKAERSGAPKVEPLYTVADAENVKQYVTTCEYGQDVELCEGVSVRFADAGHLLGSACITVTATENGETKKIIFSGDLGNVDQPIIRDPSHFAGADYVIMESTYGNRNHTEVWSYTDDLAQIIDETMAKGGNVVIPAFAVGRTQELLYFIREIKDKGLVKSNPDFPVYIDSPLARRATTIFTGDLGEVGSTLLHELMHKADCPVENHQDCGCLLYDVAAQNVQAGGSGAGCSAAVLAAHVLPGLVERRWRRVLFLSTGALMSQTTFLQGESIPGIAHCVELGCPEEEGNT